MDGEGGRQREQRSESGGGGTRAGEEDVPC